MKPAILLASLTFLMIGCNAPENHPVETQIEKAGNSYYSFPTTFEGFTQSPINILTTQLEQEKDHNIHVIRPHCPASYIINTGHTVQVNFAPGTYIEFEENKYEFQQAHFHTPSEHQIDGVTYPMELHFVSQCGETKGNNSYLVIAALFKMGKPNDFIEKFINIIPRNAGDTLKLNSETVFLDDLEKPSHVDKYDWFYYDGSLTTNPYTETVNWLVLKDILEASPKEIYHINALEGNNARHIQALYKRKVEE